MAPIDSRLADTDALLNVDRALTELRRGGLVRIEHCAAASLISAVETAPVDTIQTLTSLTGQPPALAITAPRAAVLGLAAEQALLLSLPPEADKRWLIQTALTSSTEAVTLLTEMAFRQADPVALAGIRLAKSAKLIPAVLSAPLAPAFAEVAGDIPRVTTAAVTAYPKLLAGSLRPAGEADIPLADIGVGRFILYRSADGVAEHIALIVGQPRFDQPVLVRLHSACLTGDIFSSMKCDCGEQLQAAMQKIAAAGGGVLLYLAQEGRGIGLANKLRAYALQAAGYDTVDADALLGFEPDERRYDAAAAILQQLGIGQVRLLTNNPAKLSALEEAGITIAERVPILCTVNPHNEKYLNTKIERAGHWYDSRHEL